MSVERAERRRQQRADAAAKKKRSAAAKKAAATRAAKKAAAAAANAPAAGVFVAVHRTPEGDTAVSVHVQGDVRPTEVSDVLTLGRKWWRTQKDLED